MVHVRFILTRVGFFMFEGKTILAIVPARGGSKGVPRKNIRLLAGKPLIAWTIDEAKKSRYIDRLILSSEDDEIIEVAREFGCEIPFKRPDELAQDDTPGIESVIHAINTLEEKYDFVVLLQPTSPLRTVEDIDGCIHHCIITESPACVSLTEAQQSPYWMYHLDDDMKLKPFMQNGEKINRRQNLPKVYALNGAVYVAESEFINKNRSFLTEETVGYIMSEENSLDIDTEFDFAYCEWLVKRR
jgi:CMP-N,N'-diacetyllegionaminic acid synthase